MLNNKSKLLILIPSIFFISDYYKRLYYHKIPLNALQLSSFLKKKVNIESHIVDLRFEKDFNGILASKTINENLFREKLLKVLENNFIQEIDNIAIISDSSDHFLQIQMIADTIKTEFPKKRVIVGGHHSTVVTNDFLYKNSPYDYIIEGELELNFLTLFKSNVIENNKYSKNPEIININVIPELDSFPFPDYEMYLSKYPFKDHFNFELSMSRGCPFNCNFCRIITSQTIRNYSFPKFQEIFENLLKIVLKYNKNNLKIGFTDQTFNSAKISKKVLEYIVKKDLPENIKFSCQTRIEIVSKHLELIELFKKTNTIVGYGFESANKNILKEMNKTKDPELFIKRMKKIIEKYKNISDAHCRINLIAGYPGENNKSFQETIEFLEENALYENIQISPTLFLNDPATNVYKNMNYYENKYGTVFLENWWKIPSDPLINSIIPKSSKDFNKKDLIKNYINEYSKLLESFKYKSFEAIIAWKRYFKDSYEKLENFKS